MIPGLAIAMRLLAALWFSMAFLWTTESAYRHAFVTFAFGLGCFAYGEWLDKRTQSDPR